MKQESIFSRYNLLWLFVLCYLLPILGISIYATFVPRAIGDWNVFSFGFLLTASGSLILFWAISRWEVGLHLNINSNANIVLDEVDDQSDSITDRQVIDPEEHDLAKRSLKEAQQAQIRLLDEIDMLTEQSQKMSFSKNEISNQTEKLQTELDHTKRSARHELQLQQNHIRELQEKIADLKGLNEKKQQQMVQLETKVGDLTYEIKTLLQFAEARPAPLLSSVPVEPSAIEKPSVLEKNESVSHQYYLESPIQSSQEASQQLKKCLDIAQKIKGSQRFGSQIYSFLDSPADSFSLDLRRLCDRLRGEAQSVILLYSPKDSQMLFASNLIKTLSGWSPDKFAQNFFDILCGESEWKQGVNSLAMRSESQIQMELRSRSGANIVTSATLGTIPTGIFRNHIIAVLYISDIEAVSVNNFS